MDSERLLTTGEISAALGVSRQTVTAWIRSGRLRALTIQVGVRPTYRVRERDFRDFVRRYVRDAD